MQQENCTREYRKTWKKVINNFKWRIYNEKILFWRDVGGTTVKIGFFNVDGTMLDKWEIVTNTDNGGEAILGDICKFLDEN